MQNYEYIPLSSLGEDGFDPMPASVPATDTRSVQLFPGESPASALARQQENEQLYGTATPGVSSGSQQGGMDILGGSAGTTSGSQQGGMDTLGGTLGGGASASAQHPGMVAVSRTPSGPSVAPRQGGFAAISRSSPASVRAYGPPATQSNYRNIRLPPPDSVPIGRPPVREPPGVRLPQVNHLGVFPGQVFNTAALPQDTQPPQQTPPGAPVQDYPEDSGIDWLSAIGWAACGAVVGYSLGKHQGEDPVIKGVMGAIAGLFRAPGVGVFAAYQSYTHGLFMLGATPIRLSRPLPLPGNTQPQPAQSSLPSWAWPVIFLMIVGGVVVGTQEYEKYQRGLRLCPNVSAPSVASTRSERAWAMPATPRGGWAPARALTCLPRRPRSSPAQLASAAP